MSGFIGTQRLVTDTGIMPFETAQQFESLVVRDGQGFWVQGQVVPMEDEASLQKITFDAVGPITNIITVDASATAQWITTNRGRVSTLDVGDTVSFVPARWVAFHSDAFEQGAQSSTAPAFIPSAMWAFSWFEGYCSANCQKDSAGIYEFSSSLSADLQDMAILSGYQILSSTQIRLDGSFIVQDVEDIAAEATVYNVYGQNIEHFSLGSGLQAVASY